MDRNFQEEINNKILPIKRQYYFVKGNFMKFFPKDKKTFVEAALMLLLAVAWNQAAYNGGRLIANSWHHYDMTTSFDNMVPLVPWTVVIYFGCYITWGINYYICTTGDKEVRDHFFMADAISKIICFIFFLAIPTTNIRPEITGTGIWDYGMRFLYGIDNPDNLFPSIHCLVSWFCWIGVRKRKDVHIVYRYFSLLMAIAVCVSTLTTRQHVVVDIIGAIVIAEVCYIIAKPRKINRIYGIVLEKIKRILRIEKSNCKE